MGRARRRGPRRGCSRCAAHWACSPICAPAARSPGLEDLSPLKPEIAAGTDILVVRELTGGAYFGEKSLDDDRATDLCVYSRAEIERIAHVAFSGGAAARPTGDLGRQGQRARDLEAVAQGGERGGRAIIPT